MRIDDDEYLGQKTIEYEFEPNEIVDMMLDTDSTDLNKAVRKFADQEIQKRGLSYYKVISSGFSKDRGGYWTANVKFEVRY